MNYVSLYRKYRSQNFDEIVGQQHIVRILKNAIQFNRLAHAYLFSGPRGTGKTSIARILAKALNCEHGPTPSPCGKCSLCEKIKTGQCLDVIEIDAASNRGIDEIRDLREKVRYAPVEGKYKVYIIDEVHMLTSEAFNALLKTLEEPPQNVVFVLATTELQKVPMTIASRCQRLEFRRLGQEQISGQLEKIIKGEGLEIDARAKAVIARHGEGSLRDSISLLDQLISYSKDKITFEDVVSLLGTADDQLMDSFATALSQHDDQALLALVEKSIIEGKSVPQLVMSLIIHFRNLMILQAGGRELLEISAKEKEMLAKQSSQFTPEQIKALLMIFSRVESDLRWHPQGRLILEMGLLEASTFGTAVLQPTAVKPVEAAPSRSLSQSSYSSAAKPAKPAPKVVPAEAETASLESTIQPEKIVPVSVAAAAETAPAPRTVVEGGTTLEKIRNNWELILEKVKNKTLFGYVSLHEGYPKEINPQGKLIVLYKKGFSFHKERLEDQVNKEAVEAVLQEIVGQKVLVAGELTGDSHFAMSGAAPADDGISIEMVQKVFGGRVVN